MIAANNGRQQQYPLWATAAKTITSEMRFRQLVEDFRRQAGGAAGQCHHAVQHVQPQPQVARQGGDQQQPRVPPREQETDCRGSGGDTERQEITSGWM